MSSYYYLENNEPVGPRSIAEIEAMVKGGLLSPATLICQQGNDEWREYRQCAGMDSTAAALVEAPTPEATLPGTSSRAFLVILSVIGAAGLISILGIVGYKSSQPYLAYRAATREFVSQHLTSPASAVYAAYKDCQVEDKGDGAFVVSGWVDSQNGFGAPLRADFKCRLTWLPHAKKWDLKEATIKPRASLDKISTQRIQ